MKITRLEILSVPFGGRHFHYIRLHTDEGIVGIGEAACSRKDQALIGALHDAEPHLIGADPFQIERLWSLIYRNAYLARWTCLDGGAERYRTCALGYQG